jgi:hypothetical protein
MDRIGRFELEARNLHLEALALLVGARALSACAAALGARDASQLALGAPAGLAGGPQAS